MEPGRESNRYYLTVTRNGVEVIRRAPFADYSEAILSLSDFYTPKAGRVTLSFVTEVINGRFARSYATLDRPEDVDRTGEHFERRYHHAAKHSNAFTYDASHLFLIESEFGVADCARMQAEYESDV